MDTILLVEPDAAARAALEATLREEAHVLAVDGVDAASQALSAFRPGLLVSAVDLPDGSGWDLSRLVRARHGRRVGVLLLGARGEHLRGPVAGADDVLPKPVPPALLRAHARVLRRGACA